MIMTKMIIITYIVNVMISAVQNDTKGYSTLKFKMVNKILFAHNDISTF